MWQLVQIGVKIVAWISAKSVLGGGPPEMGSPFWSSPSPLPAQAASARKRGSRKNPCRAMKLDVDSDMRRFPVLNAITAWVTRRPGLVPPQSQKGWLLQAIGRT